MCLTFMALSKWIAFHYLLIPLPSGWPGHAFGGKKWFVWSVAHIRLKFRLWTAPKANYYPQQFWTYQRC